MKKKFDCRTMRIQQEVQKKTYSQIRSCEHIQIMALISWPETSICPSYILVHKHNHVSFISFAKKG